MISSVQLRYLNRGRRLINRNRSRSTALAQKRNGNASGSCPNVANQPVVPKQLKRRFNEQFRFRTRYQNIRRHTKLASEKVLNPSDVLKRLAARTTFHIFLKSSKRILTQLIFSVTDEERPILAKYE